MKWRPNAAVQDTNPSANFHNQVTTSPWNDPFSTNQPGKQKESWVMVHLNKCNLTPHLHKCSQRTSIELLQYHFVSEDAEKCHRQKQFKNPQDWRVVNIWFEELITVSWFCFLSLQNVLIFLLLHLKRKLIYFLLLWDLGHSCQLKPSAVEKLVSWSCWNSAKEAAQSAVVDMTAWL